MSKYILTPPSKTSVPAPKVKKPKVRRPECMLYDAFISNHYVLEDYDMMIDDAKDMLKDMQAKRRKALRLKDKIAEQYFEVYGRNPLKIKR